MDPDHRAFLTPKIWIRTLKSSDPDKDLQPIRAIFFKEIQVSKNFLKKFFRKNFTSIYLHEKPNYQRINHQKCRYIIKSQVFCYHPLLSNRNYYAVLPIMGLNFILSLYAFRSSAIFTSLELRLVFAHMPPVLVRRARPVGDLK